MEGLADITSGGYPTRQRWSYLAIYRPAVYSSSFNSTIAYTDIYSEDYDNSCMLAVVVAPPMLFSNAAAISSTIIKYTCLWVSFLTRFSYIICFHFLSFLGFFFPLSFVTREHFFLTIYESILLDGVGACTIDGSYRHHTTLGPVYTPNS